MLRNSSQALDNQGARVLELKKYDIFTGSIFVSVYRDECRDFIWWVLRVRCETLAPGFVMFVPLSDGLYMLPCVIVIVILVALGYMVDHLQRIDITRSLRSVD